MGEQEQCQGKHRGHPRVNAEQGGWRQVLHHVSLDDADQLAQFQRAVRGA